MDINVDLLTAIIGAIGVFVAARISSKAETISGAADYVRVLMERVQDQEQQLEIKNNRIMYLRVGIATLTIQIINLGHQPNWSDDNDGRGEAKSNDK